MSLKDSGIKKGIWIGVATNYYKVKSTSSNKFWNDINDSQFNLYTAENSCKNSRIYADNGNSCKFLYDKSKNLKSAFRGHALIWHSQIGNHIFKKYPKNPNGKFDETKLEDHIKNSLKYYNDPWAIDVVNEAVDDWPIQWRNSEWYNGSPKDLARKSNGSIVIPSYIKNGFKLARKYAPNAKLGYNDYSIAQGTKKAKFIVDFIIQIKNNNIPIDYLGFQFHEWYTLNLAKTLNIIYKLYVNNIDIHITELDINLGKSVDYEAQALQYAAIAYISRECPHIKVFQVWGITDETSWRKEGKPLMYRDGKAKKSVQYVKDTLNGSNKWWNKYLDTKSNKNELIKLLNKFKNDSVTGRNYNEEMKKRKSDFDKEYKEVVKKSKSFIKENLSLLGYDNKENSCEVIYGSDHKEISEVSNKCTMSNNCDGIIKFEHNNTFKFCKNDINSKKPNCNCKPASDKNGHGCKKWDKNYDPWCYTVDNDPSCGIKASKNRRFKYCKENVNCNCKPISDNKRGHGCKKWDKNDDPWCYTVSNDP